MALTEQEQQALQKLCEVFDISIRHTADNPEHAFGIVTALYAYPSISDDYEKAQHRTAILKETARVWPRNSWFLGEVQRKISIMVSMPHYYVERRKSNEELISEFKSQLIAVFLLELVGIGGLLEGGVRSVGKGLEEGIKTRGPFKSSVQAGVQAAKRRILLGAGSGVVEASVLRWGAAAGIWAAIFVATMAVAYAIMLENLEDIRSEIADRYATGKATEEEYEQVQGKTFREIISDGLQIYW